MPSNRFSRITSAKATASAKQSSGDLSESQLGLNAPISPAISLPQPVLSSRSSGWMKWKSNRSASSGPTSPAPNSFHSRPNARVGHAVGPHGRVFLVVVESSPSDVEDEPVEVFGYVEHPGDLDGWVEEL